MSLSKSVHSNHLAKSARLFLALAGLLALPGCWVYSVEPLYEGSLSHDSRPDPDLTFDRALVGSWGRSNDDCLWILTVAANQQAYELTMAPAPECKSEDKSTRYQGHLLKLDNHLFLDVFPYSDEVCDLCLPLHSFFLLSLDNQSLALTPLDLDWMRQAVESKKVVLAHLSRHDSSYRGEVATLADAVVLTAPSSEVKKFVRRYADDKAAFNAHSDAVLKFKRR